MVPVAAFPFKVRIGGPESSEPRIRGERHGGTVNTSNRESRFDVNGPILGATGDAWIASADAISMDVDA